MGDHALAAVGVGHITPLGAGAHKAVPIERQLARIEYADDLAALGQSRIVRIRVNFIVPLSHCCGRKTDTEGLASVPITGEYDFFTVRACKTAVMSTSRNGFAASLTAFKVIFSLFQHSICILSACIYAVMKSKPQPLQRYTPGCCSRQRCGTRRSPAGTSTGRQKSPYPALAG